MSFVTIERLSKSFDSTMVYENVDLAIERGQICVLVGPSGCGKTTLLRTIAGLLEPDTGQICVDGHEITRLPAKDRGISMVFQQYALFPNMTVRQNLAFGLQQQKMPRPQIERRVDAMIELMGLAPRANARPAALSGGQKQRVAFARALVLEPKLLLLDEPMSALDAQIRKRLREELKRLQGEVGFTAVLVTHDQEDALIMGDRIAVMKSGRFEQVGTPLEIYNRPANRSVANFIGDFNVLDPPMIQRAFGRQTKRSWAIHPEAIELSDLNGALAAPSGHLTAEALISSVRVLGPVIRYSLVVGDTSLQANILNNPSLQPYRDGLRVRIAIDAGNIRELAD
jgi:putative spermidine/putrescine transport system ATP-binding protein